MFQIFMGIGWMVLLILLLYLWADVREMAEMLRESAKESKREQLRSALYGRSAEESRSSREDIKKKEAEPGMAEAPHQTIEKQTFSPRSGQASDEQILKEVLEEFLV